MTSAMSSNNIIYFALGYSNKPNPGCLLITQCCFSLKTMIFKFNFAHIINYTTKVTVQSRRSFVNYFYYCIAKTIIIMCYNPGRYLYIRSNGPPHISWSFRFEKNTCVTRNSVRVRSVVHVDGKHHNITT